MRYRLLSTSVGLALFMVSCQSDSVSHEVLGAYEEKLDALAEEVSELNAALAYRERVHALELSQLKLIAARAEVKPEPKAEVARPMAEEKEAPVFGDVSQRRKDSRVEARGERHELIKVQNRKYRKVTILNVTDVGVEIEHESGRARLHFRDLGEEWQTRFYYDPDAYVVALRRELERARQEEIRIAKVMAERREKELLTQRLESERIQALALAEAKRAVHIKQMAPAPAPKVIEKVVHKVVEVEVEVCEPEEPKVIVVNPRRSPKSTPRVVTPVRRTPQVRRPKLRVVPHGRR